MCDHPQRLIDLWWLVSRNPYACLRLFHASFCCGWCLDEVFAVKVLCHKRETLEEPFVYRRDDECSDRWAEHGLVHVFESIL